jgi:hypothetical protein
VCPSTISRLPASASKSSTSTGRSG